MSRVLEKHCLVRGCLSGGRSGLVRHQVDQSTYTQLLKSSIDARLLVRSDTSQGLEIANVICLLIVN